MVVVSFFIFALLRDFLSSSPTDLLFCFFHKGYGGGQQSYGGGQQSYGGGQGYQGQQGGGYEASGQQGGTYSRDNPEVNEY